MTASGKDYHRHTSYDRNRMGGHALDWSNQPDVYKMYPELKALPLPAAAPPPDVPLSALVVGAPGEETQASISLEQLSQVFDLAYSLTARSVHPGGEFFYRSVPSAGALYPCELYVATRSVLGLEDGLYHYAVGLRSLIQLRCGNCLEIIDTASPSEEPVQSTLLMFFITAIFFRSAWKYRVRSYRYHLLDSGHLIESLVLALKVLGLTNEVILYFEDGGIDTLLGCDTEREVCLALVSAGRKGVSLRIQGNNSSPLPDSVRSTSRVAHKEIAYPEVQEIHFAGGKLSAPEGTPPAMILEAGRLPASWEQIRSSAIWPEKMTFYEAVVRRRSQRNFVRESIPEAVLQAFLRLICPPDDVPGRLSQLQQQTIAAGFLADNVDGFSSGCYWVDTPLHSVGLTKSGALHSRMAKICLDQEWLARANLHFFFATNLDLLEKSWGPRGYRYAMMTAGRLGHRIYLAATSFGLGCCGIGAFYDNEAAALLELQEESAMLYLVAAGPVKRILGAGPSDPSSRR
jgi:SagB-type dehydrogenase family enzyme